MLAFGQILSPGILASGGLRAFVGQRDQHTDFAFACGAPVSFVSNIKLRNHILQAIGLIGCTTSSKTMQLRSASENSSMRLERRVDNGPLTFWVFPEEVLQ
jgi:hypothetical protein